MTKYHCITCGAKISQPWGYCADCTAKESRKQNMVGYELEILQYSYLEHFKAAKDLSLILQPEHRKRKELHKVINELLDKINCYAKNTTLPIPAQ